MIGDGDEEMNLLVIDAGNTRCKIAFGKSTDSQSNSPFPAESVQTVSNSEIDSRLGELLNIDFCLVSSVNEHSSRKIKNSLSTSLADDKLVFLSSENSTIPVCIDTPETLGPDRIASAIGAYARSKKRSIIVDSGTATTIDLVDDRGVFQGGVIMPGIEVALNALAGQTDKLPESQFDWNGYPSVVGTDTLSAMQGGVFWNLVGGVELIVDRMQKSFGAANVLFTGGSGEFIRGASALKETSSFIPALVLEGLWHDGLAMISR